MPMWLREDCRVWNAVNLADRWFYRSVAIALAAFLGVSAFLLVWSFLSEDIELTDLNASYRVGHFRASFDDVWRSLLEALTTHGFSPHLAEKDAGILNTNPRDFDPGSEFGDRALQRENTTERLVKAQVTLSVVISKQEELVTQVWIRAAISKSSEIMGGLKHRSQPSNGSVEAYVLDDLFTLLGPYCQRRAWHEVISTTNSSSDGRH